MQSECLPDVFQFRPQGFEGAGGDTVAGFVVEADEIVDGETIAAVQDEIARYVVAVVNIVLVADRIDRGTQFTRLDSLQMESWLKDYSLGQLWEKNELGGRPVVEK